MYLLQAAANAPFNWPTVIASVLGGGLISSIIAFAASKNLKATEFAYDYRKYILERRKAAYQSIEPLINFLPTVTHVLSYRVKHDFEKMRDEEETCIKLIENCRQNETWLSEQLLNSIREFELKLIIAYSGIGILKGNSDFDYDKITSAFQPVHEHAYIMLETFFRDIKHLKRIDAFVDEKLKGYTNFKKYVHGLKNKP